MRRPTVLEHRCYGDPEAQAHDAARSRFAESPLITRSKLERPSTAERAVIGTLMSKPDRVADLRPAASVTTASTDDELQAIRDEMVAVYSCCIRSTASPSPRPARRADRPARRWRSPRRGVLLPHGRAEQRSGRHDPGRRERDPVAGRRGHPSLRGPRRITGRGGPRQ